MLDRLLPSWNQHIKRLTVSIALLLMLTVQPAAAAHDNLPCSIPPELLPLFELLHTLTDVAFLMGVGLATLGFTVAGILIAGPFGDDYTQHGKRTVKRVFIGTVLLLSAGMIVSFLTSQMGGTFCT